MFCGCLKPGSVGASLIPDANSQIVESNMSNNPQRDEILRRLDLAEEFQKYGGRIPPRARPSAEGWLPVHAIDRPDEHPSAALNVGSSDKRGIYVDHAATGKGADSFFNVLAKMAGTPFITGTDAYRYYARQTGVFGG